MIYVYLYNFTIYSQLYIYIYIYVQNTNINSYQLSNSSNHGKQLLKYRLAISSNELNTGLFAEKVHEENSGQEPWDPRPHGTKGRYSSHVACPSASYASFSGFPWGFPWDFLHMFHSTDTSHFLSATRLLPNIWRIVDVFTAKCRFFHSPCWVNGQPWYALGLPKLLPKEVFFPWMNAAFRHISTPHVGDFDQGRCRTQMHIFGPRVAEVRSRSYRQTSNLAGSCAQALSLGKGCQKSMQLRPCHHWTPTRTYRWVVLRPMAPKQSCGGMMIDLKICCLSSSSRIGSSVWNHIVAAIHNTKCARNALESKDICHSNSMQNVRSIQTFAWVLAAAAVARNGGWVVSKNERSTPGGNSLRGSSVFRSAARVV